SHQVKWLYTPHTPHGWECGYLFETTTRTLFCGDLFTQLGCELPACVICIVHYLTAACSVIDDEEKFFRPPGGCIYGAGA
ncbi:hypothetical protein ABTQ08_22245, partial [Acinetobacter baumannii]